MLLNFIHLFLLRLILFVPDLQVTLQVFDDLIKLFLVLGLGGTATTSFLVGARSGSCPSLTTTASWCILAIKLALCNLLINLRTQEQTLIETHWPCCGSLSGSSSLLAITLILQLLNLLVLRLGDLEDLAELVSQEVWHSFLFGTSAHSVAIAAILG